MAAKPEVMTPTLEKILITHELNGRPAPTPRFEEERHALIEISKLLSKSPKVAMQGLVEQAMALAGADAAGISINEFESDGSEIFRWHATAGTMSPFALATMPRYFSPCGVVCDRNEHVLMRDVIRHYTYVEKLGINLFEVLLVPFNQEGQAIGTVWAVSQGPHKLFNQEDLRLLQSLAGFTSGIVQSYFHHGQLKEINKILTDVVTELESEREARERFVAALTHDLRTPLTGIKINAQLLERNNNDLDSIKRYASRVLKGVGKVETMITDLLNANKLSAGQGIPLTLSDCDLSILVTDIVNDLNQVHQARFIFKNSVGNLRGTWSIPDTSFTLYTGDIVYTSK